MPLQAVSGKLVFRVPSESDTAKTDSVSMELPADAPFRFVSTKAMPGWQVEAKTTKLNKPVTSDGFEITKAVTKVTWTAETGSALKPGEFAEFELSVGPFPKSAEELTFPTTQSYSDGEVVSWDEPTVAGKVEPEHPAPALDLTSAAPKAAAPVAPDATKASSNTASGKSGSDTVARTLGGLGLALGVIALALAFFRGRRESA